jgi:hypothetical protein
VIVWVIQPIAAIDERLAFLIADDRKAQPIGLDIGRKLFELVIGEHRKQRRDRMDREFAAESFPGPPWGALTRLPTSLRRSRSRFPGRRQASRP